MRFREIISETYMSAPPELVFHGSKARGIKDFEYRDSVRYTTFSEHKVRSTGFFFALTVEDARQFGPHVGAYHITCRKPLISGQEGVDSVAPGKVADLAYIFGALLEENTDGSFSYDGMTHRIDISAEQIADPSQRWIYEFIGSGCLDWEFLDSAEMVRRMMERGYDSTLVYEPDVGAKRAWFVVTPQQIKFVREIVQNDHDEDDEDY